MTDAQREHVVYALQQVVIGLQSGKLEEFEIAWTDMTLFESLKFAPVKEDGHEA